MSTAPTFSSYGDEYNEHGVVFMKDVLDAAAMTKVTAAYEWSHGHLTGALQDFSMSGAETFIADTNVSAKRSVYQGLLRDTVIADISFEEADYSSTRDRILVDGVPVYGCDTRCRAAVRGRC